MAKIKTVTIGSTEYDITDANAQEQISDLKSSIGEHSSIISTNLMGVDVQQNLYEGSADWSGVWLNSDVSNLKLSEESYNGYPAYYSSQGWRKIRKEIPIEAGKTYTVAAWIKPTAQATCFIYIKDGDTTNPATTNTSMLQQNNVPANTWIHMVRTFTCSASGNISPYAYATQPFYIAKYELIEGDSIFSLANELENRATLQDISGIGDYLKYTFSGVDRLAYWNTSFEKAIKTGTKCKFIYNSYTGADATWIRLDGQKSDETFTNGLVVFRPPFVKGMEQEFIATEDYISLRVQVARADGTVDNPSIEFYIATNAELGITSELMEMQKQRIFYVAKDGTGDFISFVDGINEACKYMDSVVYVGAGEYDLLDELGSAYIQNPSSDKKGLVLKNRVRVICSSQTVLKMNNTGTVLEYISPINTGEYGCTLENATIIDNKVRYSIHDDRGWAGSIPYTNKFINCTLIHKNGQYGDCIGGGLGENCNIEIRGCYLEGDSNIQRLAYYHGNNNTGVTNAKGRITVCDNYFAGDGSFWVEKYGNSTEMTTAYVSNNSFGSAPQVTADASAQDNMRIIAWNNEIRT